MKGFPREPIVVIGQSLGSAVAVQVAVDPPVRPTERLVLATPFFNLPDAASRAFWNLPLQPIVSDRYDSGSALTRYFGSLVVVVAAQDRFVGAESGRRLAKVARPRGTTTLIELAEADHNDWLSSMSNSNWTRCWVASAGKARQWSPGALGGFELSLALVARFALAS